MATEPTREEMVEALRIEIMILEAKPTTGRRHLAVLRAARRELEAGGWRPYAGSFIAIDITGQEGEAERVYGAIEKLLHEMGEVGTLSRCMRVCPPTTSDGGEG